MPRENITFKCSECGEENYIGTRNKRTHQQKMEIKKLKKEFMENQLQIHAQDGKKVKH